MRGHIFSIRADKQARGHEQQGSRYAIVIQASRLTHLNKWVVVPTTSNPNARRGIVRPVIDWGAGESVALCDALVSVDPEVRLGEQVGYLSQGELSQIDQALRFLLDL